MTKISNLKMKGKSMKTISRISFNLNSLRRICNRLKITTQVHQTIWNLCQIQVVLKLMNKHNHKETYKLAEHFKTPGNRSKQQNPWTTTMVVKIIMLCTVQWWVKKLSSIRRCGMDILVLLVLPRNRVRLLLLILLGTYKCFQILIHKKIWT